MKARLILVAGKADKGEVRLKLPTIIGRTREAGLMIAHKTVSRRHCELFERHGMLYVRDSGSLNGTLVDNAPIKESMLKPGHTVTVGPLTFRAEYEPADAFLGGDAPEEDLNGTASGHSAVTGQAGISESNRTAAMPTFSGDFDSDSGAGSGDAVDFDSDTATGSQNGAADEALDFGEAETGEESSVDFGGEETLSMQISEETTDLRGLDSPQSMPALESVEFEASELSSSGPASADFDGPATVEEDLDLAFSLDEIDGAPAEAVHVESSDDLDLDFDDSPEPAAPQAAPAVAAAADDFDLEQADDLSLELGEATADVESILPEAGEGDDLAFDFMADDAADAAPATPSAAAPAELPVADDGDEFSFAADDELDFGSPAPAAAAADNSFDLDEDDGGTFDLADDSGPAAPTNNAQPVAAEEDPLDLGGDDGMTFDLAETAEEPEPAKNAAKPAKGEAKPVAKGEPVEDDEMSDFLKELGM